MIVCPSLSRQKNAVDTQLQFFWILHCFIYIHALCMHVLYVCNLVLYDVWLLWHFLTFFEENNSVLLSIHIGIVDTDVFIEGIRRHTPVTSEVDGRIQFITLDRIMTSSASSLYHFKQQQQLVLVCCSHIHVIVGVLCVSLIRLDWTCFI